MTTRNVKYILRRALRIIGEETDYIEAPAESYERSFDMLIDMLDEWRSRGYLIIQNNPEGISDTLSSADPINALVYCLAVKIGPEFLTDVSPTVKAQASSTLSIIRARAKGLPTICKPKTMPRGSSNYYPYYFVVDGSDAICTESGAILTTGE